MNYLREKDDNCYLLSKIQSNIFERSSIKEIPSSYFVKVYAASSYCKSFDDLSWLDESISEYEIFDDIKEKTHMKRGVVYPPHVMAWIGYLLREWSYIYRMNTSSILRKVPLSFLAEVYSNFHSMDVEKAITSIAEARDIPLIYDNEQRVIDIVRQIRK